MTGIDIFLGDDRDTSQDPILSFITSIHVAIPLRTGAEFPGAVLLWLAVSITEDVVL